MPSPCPHRAAQNHNALRRRAAFGPPLTADEAALLAQADAALARYLQTEKTARRYRRLGWISTGLMGVIAVLAGPISAAFTVAVAASGLTFILELNSAREYRQATDGLNRSIANLQEVDRG